MRATSHEAVLVDSLRKDFLESVQCAGEKTVIFSSESFSGWPFTGYQNSSVAAAMLREATTGHDIKIIIYLRQQPDFIESMYAQAIQEGGTLSLDDFIGGFMVQGALMYSRIVNDVSNNFGHSNVFVRSYHAASRKGILADFGELVGVPRLAEFAQERKNPSYSLHAIEIAKRSNRALKVAQQRRLRQALQKVMAKDYSENDTLLSKAQRDDLTQRYADDNRWVVDEYFSGNTEAAFPTASAQESPYSQPTLSHEQVSRLAVELLSPPRGQRDETGLMAGARIALAGYPGFATILRKILRRR